MSARSIASASPTRAGLTLVEVSISTLLVAMTVVGALSSVASVLRGRSDTVEREKAKQLGMTLVLEILDLAYSDPGANPVFGTESDEAGVNAAPRQQFDDVDDLHGLNESPPRDRVGAPLPAFSNWRRTVAVEWVRTSAPGMTSASDQGLKRLTVTVYCDGVVVSLLTSLRTKDAWGI